MALTKKNDFHGGFIVMNQAAVDLASHATITSLDTDIPVEMLDGGDQFPLQSGDFMCVIDGLQALTAGVAVVNCRYKSAGILTLRTTNPTAGAVDPASIAANVIKFAVFRR